jgi:hypothetical protein
VNRNGGSHHLFDFDLVAVTVAALRFAMSQLAQQLLSQKILPYLIDGKRGGVTKMANGSTFGTQFSRTGMDYLAIRSV